MRIAVTAGGTGGHVLPALTVVEALRARAPAPVEIRFFGPDNRGERRLVEPSGLPFEAIPAGQIRGRSPLALARGVARLAWGTLVALRKLRAFKPDAVFSTGGYASFPTCVAARILRKPLVVFLPDVAPGWAVRAEQRLATRMATTTDAALAHLPRAKTTVTGYPVRASFFAEPFEDAYPRYRRELGITGDVHSRQILLIAGASQGAQTINSAVFAGLERLTEAADLVLHITGADDLPRAEAARDALPEHLRERYQPAAFREDLPRLMIAADLGIFRAGASILGEVPAARLASILVPGLFAGGHQRDNARWLAAPGAAAVLEEAQIATLVDRAIELLNDPAVLAGMGDKAQGLAHPDAASAIADIILEVAAR